jgi:hypothetical protein
MSPADELREAAARLRECPDGVRLDPKETQLLAAVFADEAFTVDDLPVRFWRHDWAALVLARKINSEEQPHD